VIEHTVVVDGRRVRVAEIGDGPPVVLLHGLMGSAEYWLTTAHRLAARRRVLVPDLPGHGGSDRVRPFRFEHAALLLADAAVALGASRPAVVGHSFGAPLAVCWAASRPTSALVAVSPIGMHVIDLRRWRLAFPLARALAPGVRRHAGWLARNPVGRRLVFGGFVNMHRVDAISPALGASLLRKATAAEGAVADALGPMAEFDLGPAAAAVDVPSLVIWGEHDRHGRVNGADLADALRAEAIELPGCGHMPMLESPYVFHRSLSATLGL
jgi:pimeloyl-ACP methyl ester carboxylesterase